MDKLQVILMLIIALLDSKTLAKICVTQRCHCTNNTDNTVSVTCKLQDLTKLRTHLQDIHIIYYLDLSSSQVKSIPDSSFQGFSNLINLSLSNNAIEQIEATSFAGLSHLLHLDLTNNLLKQWLGDVTKHMPRLQTLDITGNHQWLPSNNILKLQSLREIRGVTWAEDCSNCSLLKNVTEEEIDIPLEDLKSGEYYIGIKGDCRATKYMVATEIINFAKYGFYPSCFEEGGKCQESMIDSKKIHRCWDVDNNILNVEYIIAPIALVLNIIVICNTLTDRNLRRNVALLLVTNMAISDACGAVYAIMLTSARKVSYKDFLTIMAGFCPVVGFIWLAGIIVTVTTSVLLTIERYLAIVYCMRPDARLRRKAATICIVVFWVVALIIATLPTTGIGIYTSNTYCVPVRPRRDIPHMFELGIGIGSAALLLYFATIPMYIHIYVFVTKSKHSAPSAGRVRKDFCLARRIALMVLSNMMFFCIPVIIALLWMIGNITKGLPPVVKEIITGVVPFVCLTINALINPLLYAFRNDKFMHSLRTRMQVCRSRARSISMPTVSNSRSGYSGQGPAESPKNGAKRKTSPACRESNI